MVSAMASCSLARRYSPLREQAHIHRCRGLRIPQAQEVDVLGAVARDLHVAGHGEHLRRALGHDVQPSVVPELADRAAEEHFLRLLRLWASATRRRCPSSCPAARPAAHPRCADGRCPAHSRWSSPRRGCRAWSWNPDSRRRGGRGRRCQGPRQARPRKYPPRGSPARRSPRAARRSRRGCRRSFPGCGPAGIPWKGNAPSSFPRGAWPFGSPHRARSSRRAAPAPRRASPARRRPPRASRRSPGAAYP